MEQRRFILFLTLSMAILIGWSMLLAPKPRPRPNQAVPGQQAQAKQGDQHKAQPEQPQPGEKAGAQHEPIARKDAGPQKNAVAQTGDENAPRPAEAPQPGQRQEPDRKPEEPPQSAETARLPHYPHQTLRLGSLDPQSGYFNRVTLSSTGAAVSGIELNDPRYRDLDNPQTPLQLVGESVKSPKTLATSVEQIDRQLAKFKTSLNDVDWDVAETTPDPDNQKILAGVTFRFVSPDGTLEVLKRYRVKKVAFKDRNPREVRDSELSGYLLDFSLTIRNHSADEETVRYVLQGPLGLPLENAENTRKYRDIRMGFLDDDGSVSSNSMSAKKVAEEDAENTLEEWKRPFKYIGVDIQYFAVLLEPGGNQLKNPYIDVAQPMLVKAQQDKHKSDISVRLTSKDVTVPAGKEQTYSYTLYTGPKREALLKPLGAADVLDYGRYLGGIAKAMVALMNFLHNSWGIPYGIAIILLTVAVRGCMSPISRKQALSAKKMKELQPKIAELKKKYGNDKEKMARAQMELFSKHNYNPFAGCLPILLQFPIFIGLYTALRNAVDLRMASFLWIDNLAGPDALFRMPFTLPFLGQDFNLLPILSVVLFIFQQKMFTPPAAPDDEQAQMQQKMMTFMPIFFGFLFYRLPAGLCLYFVASSLWGMGERKMLDWTTSNTPKPSEEPPSAEKKINKKKAKSEGLWGKLIAAADAAAQQKSNGHSDSAKDNGGKKKKKSKSRR